MFFASDMLDLPVFLAAVSPAMGRVPTVLYFHENQLTYPLPDRGGARPQLRVQERGVRRGGRHGGVQQRVPPPGVSAGGVGSHGGHARRGPKWVAPAIEQRSTVVPVGCDLRRFDDHREQGLRDREAGRWGEAKQGPLLLWNQRWEYDKAPGDLFAACTRSRRPAWAFAWPWPGLTRARPRPSSCGPRQRLADHIVQWGKVDRGRRLRVASVGGGRGGVHRYP